MTDLPITPASPVNLKAAGQRAPHAAEGKAEAPQNADHRREMQDACNEFESLFIYHLMKEMRATIPEGYLGKSMQSETYTSLFDIEIARRLSEQKGIGLADFLMRQLADRYNQNTTEEIAR